MHAHQPIHDTTQMLTTKSVKLEQDDHSNDFDAINATTKKLKT